LISTPLNIPLLLLELSILISTWATFSVEFSLPKISGVLYSLAWFFSVVHWMRDRKGKSYRALLGFFIIGLGVAGLGLIGTDWREKLPWLKSIVTKIPLMVTGLQGAEAGIHPNELAGALLLFAMPALTLAIWSFRSRISQGWFRTVLTIFIATFLLSILLLTQSRSGLIGLAVGGGLLLLCSGRLGRIVIALGLVTGFVLIAGFGPEILGASTSYGMAEAGALGEIKLKARLEIWSRAIYGIQDFPFTGMGMGTFRKVVQVLYPLFLISPDKDIAHAHNIFLQTGLDLGLPGLIAYLAILIVTFGCLAAIIRSSPDHPDVVFPPSRMAIGLASGLCAHTVYGLTDAIALGARPGFMWWIAVGLAIGLYLETDSRSTVEKRRTFT